MEDVRTHDPRSQADTRPFTDLRIPKTDTRVVVEPQDATLVQAAATSSAQTRRDLTPADAAGPPLRAPASMPKGAENSVNSLRAVYREAAQTYAGIDSYIVRFRRREQVNGRDKPEEVLLLKFRKQPFSVSLRWLGKEGSGREVVYVRGQHEDKLHTLLAAGDMPLMPAGKRLAIAPDSVFVRSASRHSIYETGFGSTIERLGTEIEALNRGDPRVGRLRYLGGVKRPEFDSPLEAIEHVIPASVEQSLPRGGRRLAFYDPTTKLPALIITLDETGHEVEYYCFDRLQYPVKLDDDDFDPDKLWTVRKSAPPAESPPLSAPRLSPTNREDIPAR